MTSKSAPDVAVDEWVATEIERLRSVAAEKGALAAVAARPEVAPGLEILRRHARGTAFEEMAFQLLEARLHANGILNQLAEILERWLGYRRAGMANTTNAAASARVDAATDLMEQVQQLLDDRSVHPAAPVMLAGAALEEALRALVIEVGAEVVGKPGLQAYAESLKRVDRLTAQDVKDVTSWAGQRNDAAHGRFDALNRERAQLMADGINLFMRQKVTVTTP
jgi:hypothetical protein